MLIAIVGAICAVVFVALLLVCIPIYLVGLVASLIWMALFTGFKAGWPFVDWIAARASRREF